MKSKTVLSVLIIFIITISLTPSIYAQQLSDTAGCCNYVKGNVDYDPNNITDISDLVWLVDFFFSGKIYIISPIKCTEEIDINSDSTIDISDLVSLVDIIFNGTPPPYCIPDLTLNVGSRIHISMEETLSEGLPSLQFTYRSESLFGNPCYIIYNKIQSFDQNYEILFDSIAWDLTEYPVCITIPGEATGSSSIGQLSNGTYSLMIDNGSPTPFTLIVTDEYYKLIGSNERQFIIDTPIWYRNQ